MTVSGTRSRERLDRSPVDEVADPFALPDDDVRRLLRSRRRREVLRCLLAADTDEPVAVGTLARRLAEEEHHPTHETPLLQRCQRVYESLRQTHLPTLTAHGLVEYEVRSGLVAAAAGLFVFEPYLEGPLGDRGALE
ncbi:hypothetical protein ACFQGT_12490 [Natrialbaceae archaeon GCM10025810]|uniref:DUF7344 domain-containing protein n=1 Tax=Halovalidus salilacus TaxID=3075124 RepID=UPI003616B961